MTPHMILPVLALLSLSGCVAAIPLAAQLVSGAGSANQLCSMTKIPGQTASLCDRISLGFGTQAPAVQTPSRATNGTIVNTAER
jgi:hypothetical protein